MGLRPLDLANWLEIDEHYEEEIALKNSLLAERPEAVVATNAEGLAGSVELLDEVTTFLTSSHPELPRAVAIDEHPIVAASRLVQEDLCVLVHEDAWRLRAACVCFPSRWDLASKIGTTLDEIHGPVPSYDKELARPTNALFDRMTPERSFWRLNWTLLDSPALHQPTVTRQAPSGDLADWYFRVERQTLRQLPKTKTMVFTIRSYVTSAATLRDDDEDFVATLLHSLERAPQDTQHYKGWVGVAERIRAAL